MKVQLIVVQGKPEGKVIPLTMPIFKIGRGENCQLRPNSELVSREHAEFSLSKDSVSVRDLGSRNGTLVNGKALKDSCPLKDRDLVQVGPLTFAVSIQGTSEFSASAAMPTPATPRKGASPDDISHDQIDSWLVADDSHPTPDRGSGVYGGDTVTFATYNKGKDQDKGKDQGAVTPEKPEPPAMAPEKPKPPVPTAKAAPPKPFSMEEEFERLPEGEGDPEPAIEDVEETEEESEPVEELLDESNPFYVPKKQPEPAKPASSKDSSDAASDILRKMMERRRGPR
jgi:pSer/pThr/pTyr-binding forkhead associated (FHA) protein